MHECCHRKKYGEYEEEATQRKAKKKKLFVCVNGNCRYIRRYFSGESAIEELGMLPDTTEHVLKSKYDELIKRQIETR